MTSKSRRNWGTVDIRRRAAAGLLEDARAADNNPLTKLFAHEQERTARLNHFAATELSRPIERDVEPLVDKAMANREWERQRAIREGKQSPATLREIVDACED